jgi:hypothetical protein
MKFSKNENSKMKSPKGYQLSPISHTPKNKKELGTIKEKEKEEKIPSIEPPEIEIGDHF